MHFSSSDPLVHIDPDGKKVVEVHEQRTFSFDQFPTKILRDSKQFRKGSGVNTLCMTQGTLELDFTGRTVRTPILITPCDLVTDKVKKTWSFRPIEEEQFVNPFLIRELDRSYELHSLAPDIYSFLSEKGFSIESNSCFIGNFHHHRYQVLRELEELTQIHDFSQDLQGILGFGRASDFAIPLTEQNLLPADADHEAVFKSVQQQSTVVQGPPGTGKSQVLSNLVAKILHGKHTTVLVSEKRSALEIIPKKLKPFGLDKLCFVATADSLSSAFLEDLQSTWNYFDSLVSKKELNPRLSEQYRDHLQLILDLFSKPNLIGGVSYHRFKELSKNVDLNGSYSSQVPEIPEFMEHRELIEQLYKKGVHSSVSLLPHHILQRSDFHQFDVKLAQWRQELRQLQQDFSISIWKDLEETMRRAALCQVYENDLYKKYAPIFEPGSRAQKRFLSLRKKWMKLELGSEVNHSHWKVLPSREEVEIMLSDSEAKGFTARRRLRKRWAMLSHLSFDHQEEVLQKRLEELHQKEEISQLQIKFCDLGISDPANEMESIFQTISLFGEDFWQRFSEIPKAERQILTTSHDRLHRLRQEMKHELRVSESTELLSAITRLEEQFSGILEIYESLKKFSQNTLISLAQHTNYQELESSVLTTHLTRFKEQFPSFSHLEPSDIEKDIKHIIAESEKEAVLFAREIEFEVARTFKSFHELLNTPARKLSEDQKALKSRLRKGKSLLVKEFSKTRSHPSLRELFHSDAKEWILLLKPIWLSNPVQLAKCFPLERDLFDFAIFDEASQIPLQHALGTLQRCRRAIVAGDDQQMSPSSYFTSGGNDVMDLLHQASFHYKRIPLRHHYRSLHPDLIAFSNRHFYGDELKVFPGVPNSKSPIRYHYIPNAEFSNRSNPKEADALVQVIRERLLSPQSLGVVAFSEEQLSCIRSAMGAEVFSELENHQEQHGGFFKALENVQGDECDHLIVSFGYAPDTNGDFNMRFGPMNTYNGRKRLNVLLTRAIQSIEFFASVTSDLFKPSDNESVNLLRKWLVFIEKKDESSSIHFPFGLVPKVHENQLKFHAIQERINNESELVTLHRALSSRGWKVSYS